MSKEFVLLDKEGNEIDSVDPYVRHDIIGDSVRVWNDLYDYDLPLKNGNTFLIRDILTVEYLKNRQIIESDKATK